LPSTEETKREIAELVNTLKMEPEKAVANQREYRLKNGEKVWLAWTNKPIFGSEGEIKEILSIGNDVTAVRRAAEEKKVLESQLQGAQKMEAIGTLAGGIAHDFNNILQAIIGYTQILLMAKESSDPDYEKLQAIEASAQRASELTQRLLVFGRKVESKLKPVDLNQEVHQVCRMLERTIPKMIEITLDLKRDLQIINCDPVQIEQIMMNLGVNARDAMPDGGKLVFQTRNVTLDEAFCKVNLGCKPGFYVLLRVSDSGIGMEKELQDHIFEPFFTTKETGKGTGLGLAMVYGIVKSHGGYITCDSQPNQGTVFSIYFPAIQSHEKPNPMKVREMPVRGGSERILIVDDEQAIRDLGVELLGSAGYTVVTAPDGETALELYGGEDGKVDLVILDLNMPGMGGKKCLEKLLRINSGVKVIVASGYSAAGLSDDSIRMGAKGFIGKPYEMDKLLKLVREVLDRHN
jgi:signal transduction histidine kinase/ActR/RegA family two-component response regulator